MFVALFELLQIHVNMCFVCHVNNNTEECNGTRVRKYIDCYRLELNNIIMLKTDVYYPIEVYHYFFTNLLYTLQNKISLSNETEDFDWTHE